jgi:hypothetical protein
MNLTYPRNPRLQICVHGVDGSVATFTQDKPALVGRILEDCQNPHFFTQDRITIASQHSVTTFAASNIAQIDLGYKEFLDWKFPQGIRNIVELTEPEFLYQAAFFDVEHLERRRQPRTAGGPVVVFLDIEMLGGRHVFLKIMAVEELPADRLQRVHSFLAAPSLSFRRQSGGLAIVNLTHAMRFTIYPGLPEVPTDARSADEENGHDNENYTQHLPFGRLTSSESA